MATSIETSGRNLKELFTAARNQLILSSQFFKVSATELAQPTRLIMGQNSSTPVAPNYHLEELIKAARDRLILISPFLKTETTA